MEQQNLPNSDAAPERDAIIEGHRYDGIREYDNPMPGWWVWIFILCVVFAFVYVLGLHVFDFIDDYQDDLAQGIESLELQRAAFASSGGGFEPSAEALAAFVGDAEAESAGAQIYATSCAACHGNEGQGLIGPNLTDEYWIHGGTPEALYQVIATGVADKGMPPWDGAIAPEDRARVVAFIVSLAGTEPPNAKGPEGELGQ